MGASTWSYLVPYAESPDQALQRLREDVFRQRKYGDGIPSADEMRAQFEKLFGGGQDPAMRAQLEASIVKIEELRSQIPRMPEPRSIEELLMQRAESGTHSILDIQGISPVPEFGAVSPMPGDDLVRIFGTSEPTREMVEALLGDERLMEHPLVSKRWQGVFFAVYGGGRPVEFCFVGTSGD
ncbi:MAG TPA: hypothetical protein VHD32_00025 [Candidatus Didemnitutus sp.]|nr:hypothetical protein [Candidatus Didemnitutus sp.]